MARPPQQTVALESITTPPMDVVEDVVDGDLHASEDQLQAAADALNAAQDGPVDPETLEAHNPAPRGIDPAPARLPDAIARRKEIADRAAAARMDDMVAGAGVGPTTSADQLLDEAGNPLNMNAQNLYYGEFGTGNQNFMGEDLQPIEPEPAPTPEPPAHEPGMDAGDMFTVKVDGEEQQVTREDLIRSYQKDAAASRRLNEATELLKQAQNAAAANLNGQPTAQPSPQADPQQTDPTDELSFDDMDFAGLAEKIQLGETSEGAAALKDMVTQVVARAQQSGPQAPNLDIGTMTTAVRDRIESDTALNQFKNDFPEIVQDDQLYAYAGQHAVEAMIEDFVANGADEAMVAQARANPQQAINAHRAARLSGQFQGLRSPSEIYKQAGERTRDWVTKLTGQPTPNENPAGDPNVPPTNVRRNLPPRAQRARTAQQSPTLRQAPAQTPQEAPRQKTRSEKIAEMKRARGQMPAGL